VISRSAEGEGWGEEVRSFFFSILFLLQLSWFYFWFIVLGSTLTLDDRQGARGSEKA